MRPDVAERIGAAAAHAERLRQQGFHCSEAVLRGAAEALGVTIDPALLRASTGLRGGGGGFGDRCGALEAGALLIGLVYGRVEPEEDNSCAGQLVRWLHERFVGELGSTACNVLRPKAYTQWSDDFSCGPVYRRGAELAAEAILTAPALCLTCPPFDAARGTAERVSVDTAVLTNARQRIVDLARAERAVISARALEAAGRLGITEGDVTFSLVNARRVHSAWGGVFSVEGRKPDRYGLTSVVRLSEREDGSGRVEVLDLF